MSVQEKSLRELYRRALEVAERLCEDEKKLVREIVEASPNSIMYLGYIPVHFRVRGDNERTVFKNE